MEDPFRAEVEAAGDPGKVPAADTDVSNALPRRSAWRAARDFILALIGALADILKATTKPKPRKPRPWSLYIESKAAPEAVSDVHITRLMDRHKVLGDLDRLAEFSSRFHLPESDFFADPKQIARLMDRLISENPPWLHLNRVLEGGEVGNEQHSEELLFREQEVREFQEVDIFVPDDSWKDRPLSSHTLRPAKHLGEVWQARLLDQVLPPRVLLDRMNRSEVMIPIRDPKKQRLDFRKELRRIEVVTVKQVPIPIESDGGSGKGGQLLYVLLDFSASMQGIGAVTAMAVISATLRANLGQKSTRYLFRRYAQKEELWPSRVEKPVLASTLAQKDALLETIMATNFNGSATDVNDALAVACKDIERLRQTDQPDAEILLVTDGRAEMLEGTRLTLQRANIKVHTVMVAPEPNPGLEQLSESFTALDIGPDTLETKTPGRKIVVLPAEKHENRFQI